MGVACPACDADCLETVAWIASAGTVTDRIQRCWECAALMSEHSTDATGFEDPDADSEDRPTWRPPVSAPISGVFESVPSTRHPLRRLAG
jgi:hypothetical protein